jgi:hypothetical protein
MGRGRQPRGVIIKSGDLAVLRQIAKGVNRPMRHKLRAQMVLAISEGQPVRRVAEMCGCNMATVWRLCRRYEQLGLPGFLADGRKPARRA